MSAAEKTHLIRLTLKRNDAAVAPLLRDLLPVAGEDAMALHHRLLWTLYADRISRQEGETPFLWRRMDDSGRFMMLGPQPLMESPYFKVEAKPFDVRFHEGQRLAFELRLHATVDRKAGMDRRSNRTDVVMAEIRKREQEGKISGRDGQLRLDAADKAVSGWMAQRGAENGFAMGDVRVTGYRAVPPPRRQKLSSSLVGICEMQGIVQVTDPDVFLNRLRTGFGRMKAYGCGLMLVKPAG